MQEFRIAVFPGDGIGREVMPPCLALLEITATRVGGFRLVFDVHETGAETYQRTGVALPDTALRAAESAHAILLGAMGLPHVRYPDLACGARNSPVNATDQSWDSGATLLRSGLRTSSGSRG